MLVIENKTLVLPEDSEVQFVVKKPSEFERLRAFSFIEQADDPTDSLIQRAVKMNPMIESLISECVLEIKGVTISGVEIKTGKDLVKAGIPSELYGFLFTEIQRLMQVDSEDKKKL